MLKDFIVLVSSKAEEFKTFFPDQNCFNLMETDLESIKEEYVLYIERDYYKGFDFNYFLEFEVAEMNLGLCYDSSGSWEYSFDENYLIADSNVCLKDKFAFSGVALLKRDFFMKEFGLGLMFDNTKKVKSIPCASLPTPSLEKAIFLDRDGILIEDVGYPHKREHLKLNKEILPLLEWAKQENYKLIILTNQAGLAKDKFSKEQYSDFSKLMQKEFEELSVKFDGIYFCPFHKDGTGKYQGDCFLRKPWPGMLIKAIEDHNIDIRQSFMIGDKDSDYLSAPLKGNFILQGNYKIEKVKPFNSFAEILNEIKKSV